MNDISIEELLKRNERGKAVLHRLAAAVDQPEMASTLERSEVIRRITERESFSVSIERLERIADELDRLAKDKWQMKAILTWIAGICGEACIDGRDPKGQIFSIARQT